MPLYDPDAYLVIGYDHGEKTVDECDTLEEAKQFIAECLKKPELARIIREYEYVSPEEQEEIDEQEARNEKYYDRPWLADGFNSPYAWRRAMEYAG